MRRTPVRLALVAAGLAAAGLALPAHAGTAPVTLVLTDPSGDQLPLGKGDITKVTYTTTGKTVSKKVGKKVVKTYTPDALVVTLETADAIDTSGTTQYEIDAELAGCDSGFNLYYTPGVDGSEGAGCLNGSGLDITSEGVDGPPAVAGNKMTWTIKFKALSSKALKPGAVISGIDAYTAVVEPAFGFIGPYFVDSAFDTDELATDTVYKVG